MYRFGVVSDWVGFLDTPRFTFFRLAFEIQPTPYFFSFLIFCGNPFFVSLLHFRFFILFAMIFFFFSFYMHEGDVMYLLLGAFGSFGP